MRIISGVIGLLALCLSGSPAHAQGIHTGTIHLWQDEGWVNIELILPAEELALATLLQEDGNSLFHMGQYVEDHLHLNIEGMPVELKLMDAGTGSGTVRLRYMFELPKPCTAELSCNVLMEVDKEFGLMVYQTIESQQGISDYLNLPDHECEIRFD